MVVERPGTYTQPAANVRMPKAVRPSRSMSSVAAAPTSFGALSGHVFTGPGTTGLQYAFLLGLIPLFAAGLLVLPALRTYPPDVATAAATATLIADTAGKRGG